MKKNNCARILLVIYIACLFYMALNTQVEARPKDFYFPQVKVEIYIDQDGSFTVDEFRTFKFRGSFSWATLWIPLKVTRNGYAYNTTIEDFHIFDEKNQMLRTETSIRGGNFEAKWYYEARNTRRTFRIHYSLRGGIFSYPDVSELYWQVIGSGWDRPTKQVTIDVHLPQLVASKKDILVYGHGPLSGRAEIIDLKTARFTVSNLASHQHVEIRMAWPAGIVEGIPSTRHTFDSIKREEARFVQETIEQVQRTQEAKARKRGLLLLLLSIWGACIVIVTLVWLAFYLHSWKKVGKDYSFDDIPRYFRELPSKLSPALVEVLLREGGAATPRAFTATLFDLARRGYTELEDRIVEKKRLFGTKKEVKTTVKLQKDFRSDSGLFPYEKEFMGLLFSTVSSQGGEKGAKLELDELREYLKEKPREFQKWYKAWQKMIEKESKKLQFIEPKSTKMRNVFLAFTIPIAILTANPILGILAGILVPKLKRRDLPWARENEQWKALERFLDDFSSFKDLPPEAYKLWEHYLVFGIIFGNAKAILDMLPVILKHEQAVAPIWYYGFDRVSFISTGRLQSMIQSIESMATTVQQASASAAHYSSGGGGGFSSGGGGGGGGGGGTAG